MGYRPWPWNPGFPANGEDSDGDAPAFIVETHQRNDIGALESALTRSLAPGWSIRPLFVEAADESVPDDFNLSCFWELRLPGPQFHAWTESPYDLAYQIMELTNARSVEPDLPVGFNAAPDISGGSRCEEPISVEPTDRAWALRSIKAPQAWHFLSQRRTSEGRDILIAQPDTGVATHNELIGCLELKLAANLIEPGTPPTDPLLATMLSSPGHGTGTASVAASRGGVLAVSTAPLFGTSAPGHVTGATRDAKIVPIRAIKSVVRVTQGNVAKAVYHAWRSQCQVISMSLGGLPLRALEAALARALSDHTLIVSAAGNCVGIVVWPARYKTVIGIGGTNERLAPWKGTSRGKRVDVCAPAEFVWRATRTKPTEPHDMVSGGQGTSFATAMTAGVAALWLNDRRNRFIKSLPADTWLQEAFRHCLKSTANVPKDWDTAKFGAGIVDAFRLLQSDCGPGAADSIVRLERERYAPQIEDTCDDLQERREKLPSSSLVPRIRSLSRPDRERFGHEILALLAQEAWFMAGTSAGKAAELKIPVLYPSKSLAVRLAG